MPAQGTAIGIIQNTTIGSTISIQSQSITGAFQVAFLGENVWQLQLGPSAPNVAGTLSVVLRETLPSAANSPRVTGPITILEIPQVNTSANGQFDFSNAANSDMIWEMYGF